MVRLNKNQLPAEDLDRLLHQLDATFSKLSLLETHTITSSLLGAEERIMLAKRLAMVVLLVEGKTLYFIAQHLRVSPATVSKIQTNLHKHDYDDLLLLLNKNKKQYLSILETLDSVLHLGGVLPHYNGLDRYRPLK